MPELVSVHAGWTPELWDYSPVLAPATSEVLAFEGAFHALLCHGVTILCAEVAGACKLKSCTRIL